MSTTFVNVQTSAETFSEPLPFQHFLGDYAAMSSASPRPGPDSATTPALCDQACRADASCEVWKFTTDDYEKIYTKKCQLYDISGNQQSGIKINPTLRSTGSTEIYSDTVPLSTPLTSSSFAFNSIQFLNRSIAIYNASDNGTGRTNYISDPPNLISTWGLDTLSFTHLKFENYIYNIITKGAYNLHGYFVDSNNNKIPSPFSGSVDTIVKTTNSFEIGTYTSTATTASSCETTCNSDSTCGAYSFDPSLNTCTLFTIGLRDSGNVGTSRSIVNLPTLTITGTPTIDVYKNLSFTFTTTDATSVNLSWTPSNRSLQNISSPFNQKIPGLANGGDYTFTLTVSNSSGITRSTTFTLTVPTPFVNLIAKVNASGSLTLKADSSIITGNISIVRKNGAFSQQYNTTFENVVNGITITKDNFNVKWSSSFVDFVDVLLLSSSELIQTVYSMTQGKTQEIIIDSASQYLNTIRINSTPYGLTTSSIKYTGTGQNIIVSDDLGKIFVQDQNLLKSFYEFYNLYIVDQTFNYIPLFYSSFPNDGMYYNSLSYDLIKNGFVWNLPSILTPGNTYTLELRGMFDGGDNYSTLNTFTFTVPQAAVNYGTTLSLPIFGAPTIKVEQLSSSSMTYYIQIPEVFLPPNVNDFLIYGDIAWATASDVVQFYYKNVLRTDLIKGLRIPIDDISYFTSISLWDSGKKIRQNTSYSWSLIKTDFTSTYINNINFDTNAGSIGSVTIPSSVSVRAYKSDDLSAVSDVFTVSGLTTPSLTNFTISAISTTSITFSGTANLPGFLSTDTINIYNGSTLITTCTRSEFTSGITKSVTLSSGSVTIQAKVANDETIVSESRNATVAATGATGGTITKITVSGIRYNVHEFTNSGNFVTPASGLTNVEILLVGGGGGGGSARNNSAGGGGGGGCVITTTLTSLSTGTYPIVIGAGGNGGIATSINNPPGANGSDTTFNGLTAKGGGGGSGSSIGGTSSMLASSGGGSSSLTASQTITAGTASQKRTRGGSGATYSFDSVSSKIIYYGGGGGGAGTVGQPGSTISTPSSTTSKGGDGFSSSITGNVVNYGAGGGGGIFDRNTMFNFNNIGNTGGSGGGGRGAFTSTTANNNILLTNGSGYGSGGGGAATSSTSGMNGGNGSNGVVYIRYVVS